jgi:hypothetical protein
MYANFYFKQLKQRVTSKGLNVAERKEEKKKESKEYRQKDK